MPIFFPYSASALISLLPPPPSIAPIVQHISAIAAVFLFIIKRYSSIETFFLVSNSLSRLCPSQTSTSPFVNEDKTCLALPLQSLSKYSYATERRLSPAKIAVLKSYFLWSVSLPLLLPALSIISSCTSVKL